MLTMLTDKAQAGQMLSLNELCQEGEALWQKVMSGRVSQSCREGDRAARSCLWKRRIGLEQPAALGNHNQHGSPHQLHCTPLSFFSSSLFLQFIFLTRSMMLLQTENNRDRVSAKAISGLNQSKNNLDTEQLSRDSSVRGDRAVQVPCPSLQLPSHCLAGPTASPTQQLCVLPATPFWPWWHHFPPPMDANPHPSAKPTPAAAAQ